MTDEARRAERKLAALMLTELDVDVEPDKLRGFIKAHWRSIAPLAHIIHAAPDYTKSPKTASDTGNRGGGAGYAC